MRCLLAFIHPNPDLITLNQLIKQNHCDQAVYVSQLQDTNLNHNKKLENLVQACWELDEVSERYQLFIANFQTVLKELKAATPISSEQAFVIRTLLVHEYRRAQLHDPQLPIELLPTNWAGKQAYELCQKLYRLLMIPSQEHILSTLRAEDENASDVGEDFYERFGGLRQELTGV